MKTAKIAFYLTLCATSVVFAAVESSKAEQATNYFLCKNQKTVRTIRVENDSDAKKCVAVYTKAGVDREVGRAQNISTCMKVAENIKVNLEAANWKCRALGDVRITSSASE